MSRWFLRQRTNDRAFEDACEDSTEVWATINFVTLLTHVKSIHGDSPAANVAAQHARAVRDERGKRTLAALKLYRKTAQAFLPPGHALLTTLPSVVG